MAHLLDFDASSIVALITGGTSGIGREVALALAQRGATVIVVGRSEKKRAALLEAARELDVNERVEVILADLSTLHEVRRVASHVLSAYARLDLLVHSAGAHPQRRALTPDGVEANFAVNYLNKFVLTDLLLERLYTSAPARVVVVGSPYVFDPRRFLSLRGVYWERPPLPFWSLVKAGMAVSVWAVELARRLEGSGVSVNTAVPGVVRTDILRDDPVLVRWLDRLAQPFVGMSTTEGAMAPLHLALSRELDGMSGRFYKGTRQGPKRIEVPRGTYDCALAGRLWAFSERLAAAT